MYTLNMSQKQTQESFSSSRRSWRGQRRWGKMMLFWYMNVDAYQRARSGSGRPGLYPGSTCSQGILSPVFHFSGSSRIIWRIGFSFLRTESHSVTTAAISWLGWGVLNLYSLADPLVWLLERCYLWQSLNVCPTMRTMTDHQDIRQCSRQTCAVFFFAHNEWPPICVTWLVPFYRLC